MDRAFIRRMPNVQSTQNETNAKRLIKTKLRAGPVIERTTLGDVKNQARTFLNAKRVLKKNEGTSNLNAKVKETKENASLLVLPQKATILGKKPVVCAPKKTAVHALKKPEVCATKKPEVHALKKPEVCALKESELSVENKIEECVEKKAEPMEISGSEDIEIDTLSSAFSSNLICVEDIDKDDALNPQLVSQYTQDIYKHLWALEDKHPVQLKHLAGQEITYKMRGVLIDWLIQVHLKFSLIQETLYLTVAILDRFLQIERSITKEQLQLVGITSMLIACKYEEMYIPEIADFAFVTAKAYTTKEIRMMEIYILTKLSFYVSFPLHLHFLRRNSKAGQVDGRQHTLAKYLMELTLPEYAFCAYKPSKVAAASLYLSIQLIGNGKGWNETMTYYSKYTEKDIMPVVCQISSLLIKPAPSRLQVTIRNKYKASKFFSISQSEELKSTSKILCYYASRIVPYPPKTAVKS